MDPCTRRASILPCEPSYLSFVYPWSRWTVSIYRHELVLQTNDFLSNGAFEALSFGSMVNNGRQLGLQGSREISVDNYGGAVAYRINDALSAGVGLSVYRLNLTASFGSFGHTPAILARWTSTSPRLNDDANRRWHKGRHNLGVLWTVDPRVRFGMVFRQGMALDFTQVDTVPGSPTPTRIGDFRTPHVFGAGVRVAVQGQLVVQRRLRSRLYPG